MNSSFTLLDYIIVAVYAIMIIGIGLWVSRSKKGVQKTSEDYFLASKSLPWWAIGASLIAANISAEQFIGMSGSGFAGGMAIAAYEFMAALTLIIVGKFFLPIFIKQGIYTIPEFVEKRFSTNLKTILAVFWIALFIFVNLTSVLYLGGKAIDTIVGNGDGSVIIPAIIILSLIAAAYSLYGGLSAVAWTDIIQVVLLVIGGLITTLIALYYLGGDSIINGISHLSEVAGDKFDLVLSRDHKEYNNLPGIYVLIGGLWVANLYYWGFNQYIIQRTLAAKSLKEAQRGIAFAAFLKMIIPFIVVIPGIVAWVMYSENFEGTQQAFEIVGKDSLNNDNAYPWLISTFVPTGLKGLVLAALSAAIISSLASMLNSTSTIFTMDIFKPYIKPQASQKQLVNVGRVTAAVALIIACCLAPLLGGIDQMFQYIQEYTGVVSPGILAVFIMGLFWKKATNKGAIWGILSSIPVALFFKFMPLEMPFMDQMFYTFLITIVVIFMVSLSSNPFEDDPKAMHLTKDMFVTDKVFNVCAYVICILLAVIYAVFW